MKIALLEYDTRIDNENINRMLKINQKYCKLNNYDFIFDNLKIDQVKYHFEDFVLDQNDIFNIKLYFHRFEMFQKYINDYDYLVSFDSDICVNNPFIKIENLIDNQHDYFITQDLQREAIKCHIINAAILIQKYYSSNINTFKTPYEVLSNLIVYDRSIYKALCCLVFNPNGYNNGFIIIKCSDIIRQFISNFKKYYILFANAWYDQGCTGYLLNCKKYKNISKILPDYLQGNPFINLEPYSYNEDKNFICHFYGNGSKKDEIKQYLNEIQNNKWWTQIK